MTALMPCPRCTQLLPVTAGFCRRCGMSVRAAGRVAPPAPGKSWAGIVVGISTVVVAMVVIGLVGIYGSLSPTPPVTNVVTSTYSPTTVVGPKPMPTMPPPRVVYPLDVPRVYPPTFTVPPGYPPMRPFTPTYPVRPGPNGQQNWAVEQEPRTGRR